MFNDLPENAELDREQFRELLKKIDSGLRALPATAQVGLASQPGGRARAKLEGAVDWEPVLGGSPRSARR